jgi:hypothetical protein
MSDYSVARPPWPRRAPRRKRPGKPTWREEARAAIVAAIAAGKELGLEGRRLELHVSRTGYPFQVRCNHPYRAWLYEFHAILHGRRVPFDPRARARLKARAEDPRQARLF